MTVPRESRDFGRKGIALLAALVVGLGGVVYLAMPKADDLRADADAGTTAPATAPTGANARTPTTILRFPDATVELAVLTSKPEEEARALATPEALVKLLDIRHCGGACDAVKKLMADKDHFELEVSRAEEYILPAKESWPTIAPSLSPAERDTIGQRSTAFVVRVRGASTIDQLPARAGFAAATAAAEALSGLVYDEVVRRIERADELRARCITVPLGQNVFSPRHITVQVYREDDGTARLLSLGMVRFGSSDFSIRNAPPELAPQLASILNTVASQAAGAKAEITPLTLDEVARVNGRRPADLAKDPGAAAPLPLETTSAERVEGDPENEMLEIIPHGGGSRESWTSAASELFGRTAPVLFVPGKDAELDAIATRARADLPGAVKRFEKGEGALFVKGPFAIPAESKMDGGPSEEWMWMQATTCDRKSCSGLLSNTPGYATNLAAGKEVSVPRDQAADWLLRLPDGGAAGGASVDVLQKRAAAR